ncbi:MAG: acyl-CoA dehydrogenase family protein [Chloroflexi bacterium]|nr:acyl-CoA dehydrogenase family protein [Chloroflexota bacterium]
MDLDFGPKAEALRKEVREFIKKEWTPKDEAGVANELPEYRGRSDEFSKKLGKKGWLGIGWPKEYGGLGKSYIEQLAFAEELGYHRAPMGKHHMAVNIVGPTLQIVGSEHLKKKYLPKIQAGEIQTCIGYSEPGAGSDLASLQTRAVEDGDDYVVNGQKIFTTGAEKSDICWLGARTDPDKPKHKGVSLFILPMDTPGITITPIWCVGGLRTNQVFFENVRIPKSQMVGERGQGFYNIAVALDFERVMTVDLHVARLLTFKVMWMIDNKLVPNAEASLTKVFSTELQVRLGHVGMSVIGPMGPLYEESKYAPMKGDLAWLYEVSLLGTIGGGSNEIQRNIIAQRGLGMGR